jgi:RNA polymerase sigma-70 factor, ECF subfamily
VQKLSGHVLVPAAPPILAEDGTSCRRSSASEAVSSSVSFDAFYRKTWRFVLRCLGRLGVPPSALDDVFQEVFLVVHRRLPEYQPPPENQEQAERVWVFQILRFVIRSHRRQHQRKEAAFRSDATDLESVPAATETPLVIAERSERVRLLYDLLATLDDGKRELFVLVELEGLSVPDAASALGLNERTAYSRLNAARTEFSKAFERSRARDEWRLK